MSKKEIPQFGEGEAERRLKAFCSVQWILESIPTVPNPPLDWYSQMRQYENSPANEESRRAKEEARKREQEGRYRPRDRSLHEALKTENERAEEKAMDKNRRVREKIRETIPVAAILTSMFQDIERGSPQTRHAATHYIKYWEKPETLLASPTWFGYEEMIVPFYIALCWTKQRKEKTHIQGPYFREDTYSTLFYIGAMIIIDKVKEDSGFPTYVKVNAAINHDINTFLRDPQIVVPDLCRAMDNPWKRPTIIYRSDNLPPPPPPQPLTKQEIARLKSEEAKAKVDPNFLSHGQDGMM